MNNEVQKNDDIQKENINRSKSSKKERKKKKRKYNTHSDDLNKKVTEVIRNGIIDENENKLILSCKTDPFQRTIEDIARIKIFLSKSELALKFRSDNIDEESLRNILFNCANQAKYQFLQKDTILFRIGERGDKFFFIIQGKIDVLKPLSYFQKMTGYEYFLHLMRLLKDKETHILKLTIEANKDFLPITKNEINVINFILLRLYLDEFFDRKRIEWEYIEHIFRECFVDFDSFNITIDSERLRDSEYESNTKEKILSKIPKFSSTTIEKFRFLLNRENKYDISLFSYKKFLELLSGNFFGDSALDKDTYRNATIKTSLDTHFLYLDSEQYSRFLKEEKKRITAKEVAFLLENFIFKLIPIRLFENKLLNYFIYEEKGKGEKIIIESTPVDFIYFIMEGNIEITVYKNILELFNLLEYLSKLKVKGNFCIKNEAMESLLTSNNIKNEINELNSKLMQKNRNKLFKFREKDTLGMESFFFGMDHLVTAEVVSEKVKYFKLEVRKILKIMNIYGECYPIYQNAAIKRVNILFSRILSLIKVKMEMIDYHHTNLKLESLNIENNSEINNSNNQNRRNFKVNIRKISTANEVNYNKNKILSSRKIKPFYLSAQKESVASPTPTHIHSHTQSNYNTMQKIPMISTVSFSPSINNKSKKKLENICSVGSFKRSVSRGNKGTMSLELEKQLLSKVQRQAQKDILFWKTLMKKNKENDEDCKKDDEVNNVLQPKVKMKKYKITNYQYKRCPTVENEKINVFTIFKQNNKNIQNNTENNFTYSTELPELCTQGEFFFKSFRSKKYEGKYLKEKQRKYINLKKIISKKLEGKENDLIY